MRKICLAILVLPFLACAGPQKTVNSADNSGLIAQQHYEVLKVVVKYRAAAASCIKEVGTIADSLHDDGTITRFPVKEKVRIWMSCGSGYEEVLDLVNEARKNVSGEYLELISNFRDVLILAVTYSGRQAGCYENSEDCSALLGALWSGAISKEATARYLLWKLGIKPGLD